MSRGILSLFAVRPNPLAAADGFLLGFFLAACMVRHGLTAGCLVMGNAGTIEVPQKAVMRNVQQTKFMVKWPSSLALFTGVEV